MTTHVTPASRHWTAWHLHVGALGAGATDEVVRHVVGPAVAYLRQSGDPTSWFFLRYWQHGPHVRFRVAGLPTGRRPELDRLLRERMTEVLAGAGPLLSAEDYRRHAAPLAAAGEGGRPVAAGGLLLPGVYRCPYRPEVGRYGGPALLAVSESLFEEASRLALAFLRMDPPEAARSGLGLAATQAALAVLADDDARLRLCRQAAAGWQGWAESGGGDAVPAVPRPDRLAGRTPAPVRRWADQVGRAMTLWRAGTGDGEAERILHSHVHMLHNRLGLSVGQEWVHYVVLAESLGPVPVARVAS